MRLERSGDGEYVCGGEKTKEKKRKRNIWMQGKKGIIIIIRIENHN